MIKFFRQIRFKLIETGKTTRYFKYAIGEILLVVIGILIALQINNWNEEKKGKAQLNQYLLSLKENIKTDIFVLDSLIVRRELIVKYCKKEQLNFLNKEYKFNDTRNALKAYIDFYFKPNTSGYDALKNSPYLGKLNGTMLNKVLINYYAEVHQIQENEKSYNEFLETLEAKMAYDIDRSIMMAFLFVDEQVLGQTKTTQEEINNFFKELHKTVAFRNIVSQAARQDGNIIEKYDKAKSSGLNIIKEIDNFIN